MKSLCVMLTASLFAVSVSVWGQPSIPRKPESTLKAPADPGMRNAPDVPMTSPSNSGVVVVPPKTDPKAIKTPPKNVDPDIASPTKDIDKKNRKKSQDKGKAR
jgi:hypothetical protein